ncbi:MAG: type II toxin-antitoxin system RelE/ParE family toxin [Bacteroidetes bacterium]|nr:type II toxin-antitoxin system RelE/ParE family toxin [Bacteroidota bacterium]
MSFNIIPISGFVKELKKLAKKYPSLKLDYLNLLDEIEVNPTLGTPLGKNCFKIRLAITSKGKGKSGGARVITHLIVNVENKTLYLLKIYDKSEQDNISDNELKQLLESIKTL